MSALFCSCDPSANLQLASIRRRSLSGQGSVGHPRAPPSQARRPHFGRPNDLHANVREVDPTHPFTASLLHPHRVCLSTPMTAQTCTILSTVMMPLLESHQCIEKHLHFRPFPQLRLLSSHTFRDALSQSEELLPSTTYTSLTSSDFLRVPSNLYD